jgi:hypothetical protein
MMRLEHESDQRQCFAVATKGQYAAEHFSGNIAGVKSLERAANGLPIREMPAEAAGIRVRIRLHSFVLEEALARRFSNESE